MTHVTAVAARAPSKRDAYLDWLQMLTGVALILFLWAHLFLVSSVIIGPGVMNSIAHFFEATGMAQVGGPAIFLVFLLHFVLASRKIPFRVEKQRLIWDQARMLNHRDTWLWLVQAGTAMIILVMGAIHMWVVLTDLPITAEKSAARIQGGFWLVFYLFLLPMAELHTGVGLYRIGVKWGFIRSDNRPGAKRAEMVLVGVFITIGLLALARFMTLSTAGAH